MANTGGLSAQVFNIRNNQPIEGANVQLSGAVDERATTTSDGGFKFNGLPPANNYMLEISANGFRSERYEDIVVIENNVTDLARLMLWPED